MIDDWRRRKGIGDFAAVCVSLPPSVTDIGAYAFAECSRLTFAELPNAAQVGESAFQDCTGYFFPLKYNHFPLEAIGRALPDR